MANFVEADVEGRRPTILIVDDELLNRKLVAGALEAAATYELLEAVDGVEAQAILLERPVDVVVTDLMMPRLDGLGLLRWAVDACPGPTFIIHSALDTFDAAVKALQLGAFDFVAKPLHSVRLLQSSVGNAVRQRRLIAEQDRLRRELEHSNERLRVHVAQLEEVCRLLREQADTIEDDLRRAELIQRALLPRAPAHLEGFAVDAVYRPSHSVGGDLYDVVRLDDRFVVLYVADAAGHGVSAAMLSVVLKHRLRMVDAQGHPHAPAQVLSALNAELCEECTAPGLFVTSAYCLLDTHTREVVIAAAGHPPIALRRGDGQVTLIERTGPALGLSRSAQFGETRVVLASGDRLLLYTDGLCDTSTDGDPFDPPRIADALAVGHSLVLDLSRCTYLDSTFLGTIHELVERERPGGPSVRIQGAPADVRHLFDELAMNDVLAHVATETMPPPAGLELTPLTGPRGAPSQSKERILSAHEALLGLSDKNREQFQGVVDALRTELH